MATRTQARWLGVAFMAVSLFALPPALLAQPASADGRYMIEFRRFGPDAAATVRAAGGQVVHEFPDLSVVAAWLPAAALQGLRNNPNVVDIEEDPRRYPFAQTTPYGIPMVQADTASGVLENWVGNQKVCIIDSGYFRDHEDLQSATTVVTGTPNSGTGDWFTDRCGHGTHVAGTIAALGNTVGVVGVVENGGLNLHIVKVFGDNCSWAYSSDLVAAATACQNAGSNIISMSLGGSFKSRTEENKFNDLYNNRNVLSVAAAGNAGNTQHSYPASYSSVISVAAIDSNKVVATFSQQNNQVELAAPGVGVLSTVPWVGASLTVDSVTYLAAGIEFAATTDGVSGALVNGARCTSTGSWGGKVVLCERGDISFFDKVMNVQNSGGVAAVIYNNVPGGFAGTLGAGNSSTIPAISISQEDGQYLVANKLNASGTVVNSTAVGSGYEAWDGTSMATPHVSAVAALVWSHNTGWSNATIRDALQKSAEDLGAAGRDNSYGYGLVQAKAAICYLAPAHTSCTGGTPTNSPPTADFTFTTSSLTASFTDTSTDSDGAVVSWSWNFGDGNTSTAQHPSHTYAAAGTYTVTLTVTDNEGAPANTSKSVTVSTSAGITLSATGYKVKGVQHADLTWSGATGGSVDIFRNNTKITTDNDGAHTDVIGGRGGGSYTYKLCEAGTTTCSNEVTVSF
jgi:serine protease